MGRHVEVDEKKQAISVKIWNQFGGGETQKFSSSCEASYQPIVGAWFIDTLHVHWKVRNKRIGSDLLKLMKEAIQKAGGTKIMLSAAGTTIEKQKKLREFYEGHGFNVVNRAGSNSLLMEFHFDSES
jgi:ribosomal protein S18 acetylase RimI-like enzyme